MGTISLFKNSLKLSRGEKSKATSGWKWHHLLHIIYNVMLDYICFVVCSQFIKSNEDFDQKDLGRRVILWPSWCGCSLLCIWHLLNAEKDERHLCLSFFSKFSPLDVFDTIRHGCTVGILLNLWSRALEIQTKSSLRIQSNIAWDRCKRWNFLSRNPFEKKK